MRRHAVGGIGRQRCDAVLRLAGENFNSMAVIACRCEAGHYCCLGPGGGGTGGWIGEGRCWVRRTGAW